MTENIETANKETNQIEKIKTEEDSTGQKQTIKKRIGVRKILLVTALLILSAGVLLLLWVKLRIRGEIPKEGWLITQYGGDDKPQMMFYTIVDSKGNLVVIDGGWGETYNDVACQIRDYGWHVSAWIITHPHYDHIGAFNAIMEQDDLREKIKIDRIYATPVHDEAYEKSAKDYDGISTYYKFKEYAETVDNITYVNPGDVYDILGLKMEVISSWDENVDTFENNQCNDGSIMFKISGEEESMLFCADVQKEMEQFIVPGNEEKLKADYVQCGHHGNWGLTAEFYDIVDPSVAFMDSPSYIIEDTEGSYDAYLLKRHFEEKGITVRTLKEAPYSFILK